ncbi:MAG: GIY-YIG nuclease family protein [Candidatus Gastranaerophilales bacterium]|nr:GIY-YIG nuclease family protein [Candidatus Gastranaerophilales bacterium]
MENRHFVYILETENNTLYCGYTDDVKKRYQAHLEGKGAKYTRANKPVKLVWQKEFKTKSEALKEEYRIKHKLTRKQKLELIIDQQNPLHSQLQE